MNSVMVERNGPLNVCGQVSDIRAFRDELLVFDLEGRIQMARSEDNKIQSGDTVRSYMTEVEWNYLRKNCLSYECARALVNTRRGAMLVFCNMLASMHVMIGVIFRSDRGAVVHYFERRVTMVDRISPRFASLRRTECEPEQLKEVEAVAELSFSAFSTAAIRTELARSLLEATPYIVRRLCVMARMIGCRVNCRSIREFAPRVEDFNGDAFVAMALHLMFFVYYRCPDRVAEIEVGDFDSRPFLIFRCQMPSEEDEVFVNRRYRYAELAYCDALSSERSFPFECSVYAVGLQKQLRAAFCPKIRYVEGLHVKEPQKKLDYSDYDG